MRSFTLGTIGLAAALLATACANAPDETSRHDTLVLGSISDVDSWNPYLVRQAFSDTLLRRIYLPLASPGGTGAAGPPTFEPVLAESWSFSDDGLTLTFRLREAAWSDGRPITADDVVFSWRVQTSPEVAWVGNDSKSRIEHVEAVGERGVVFRFARRYPDQLADACEGVILPRHVFGELPFSEWLTHDWSALRIGAGPFLLEEHRPADRIVLTANPDYFQAGLPEAARVVVKVVPDVGNLLLQLLAGDLDYVRGIPPREAARAEKDPDTETVAYDRAGFDFIGWNGTRPPFDDPEVRRALTLAIDRQALVDELLYGYGKIGRGPIPSFLWTANDALEAWPHDPREALRLLAGKGWTSRDGDEILVRDGKPFRFQLVTNAGNALREAAAVKIQAQLRKIGIRVDVQPMEMRAVVDKFSSGDYDAYLLGLVFSGKIDLRGLFGSSGASNVTGYRSERVDRLLDDLDDAHSREDGKTVLDAIQQEIHRDLPLTFLYEEQRIDAHRRALKNVRIDVPSDPLRNLERYRLEP